jgi:2-polyprenyl-3-methyl-5-hydroxy-6-metoxy-1,4-benzoquinol methylase
VDRDRVEAFLELMVSQLAGTTTVALLAVADRCGLSAYLGEHPRGTAEEIATGAGLDSRYVQEVLSGLAAAGVVEYDPETGEFHLPPEHALFVAGEVSPYFMGGWFDMLPAVMDKLDAIAEATVHGGGVPFEEYGDAMVRGIDRGNSPSQRAFLTSRWLPGVPGLVERLEEGIRVADVGCGAGTAAIMIAAAYPNSDVHGFDVSEESIALARSRAEGLSNIEFALASAEEIPTDPGFDLITSFDVIHDLVDPAAALRRIREALRPGGVYLMMEPRASSRLEENLDARGALLYGISTLHCMTQSLARGGAGLGAAGGAEKAEEMAKEAGFSSFALLEKISNRFSNFYLLEP